MLDKIQISSSATISKALEALNDNPWARIVFVVAPSGKVLSCITDGDVRRGLLRGETLNSLAEKVARKDFISVDSRASDSEILKLMQVNGVRQIPILDPAGGLIGLKLIDDLLLKPLPGDFPAVIMAGGRGARMMPLTEALPKPLLKLGDRTLIERMVTDLKTHGVTEFFVTVNYLKEKIISHLGDGSRFGCRIEYIHEPKALGTAGSLALLRQHLQKDFLVINGDVLSTVDLKLFSAFHREHGATATVCSKLFTVNIPYGVVNLKGSNITTIDEKPDLSFIINSGIYFLSPKALESVEEDVALDMPELIEKLIRENKTVKCFQSTEPWIDVGSHGDFEKAQKYLEYFNS